MLRLTPARQRARTRWTVRRWCRVVVRRWSRVVVRRWRAFLTYPYPGKEVESKRAVPRDKFSSPEAGQVIGYGYGRVC